MTQLKTVTLGAASGFRKVMKPKPSCQNVPLDKTPYFQVVKGRQVVSK